MCVCVCVGGCGLVCVGVCVCVFLFAHLCDPSECPAVLCSEQENVPSCHTPTLSSRWVEDSAKGLCTVVTLCPFYSPYLH